LAVPGRWGELGSESIAESVAVAAARVLFHRADVRVSILWGDPVGEGGGGGRALGFGRERVPYGIV